jgi:hypothetical protein
MEHLENIVLGPRYAVRLRDLREWHVIKVTCAQCQHEGTVTTSLLTRHRPEYTRLVDLERCFRCTQCGNREENHWQIVQLPR